jgi:anti-sigma B factor antagonist
MGIENNSRPRDVSTAAAIFDTNYSSPAFEPAKKTLSQRNPLDAVYRMAKMPRATNFVGRWTLAFRMKIYQIFMVPKPIDSRLSTNMQTMESNWQTWEQPAVPAAFRVQKEPKLKLDIETRSRGDVVIVHCQGRIVYRDEASALSRLVGELLQEGSKVVLELSGVSAMDSAGIGELALLQSWAQERRAEFKCAGANPMVRTLLDLTNLDSVVEVHPTLDAALESYSDARVCADC